ncbi:MAG: 3-deoxy-7-phosphoheptulonate synthase [Gammaproteobacteria bacterium]|nr:MAG: 3-deoxy-7-phosphoheptulonate synthase [Gammaproteobacteria bacterium]
MIIVLKSGSSEETAKQLMKQIEDKGLQPLYMPGDERTVLGALGDERILASLNLESHPAVDSIKPILSPYKKVSRELHPEDTKVQVAGTTFGGEKFVVIAGPCAVESQEQINDISMEIKATGGALLRGGIFKPRTSPYSFQGLGREGMPLLVEAGEKSGLGTVSEVTDVSEVEFMQDKVAMLQIGARNMQNYRLLQAVGETNTPVLLKRGMSSTIEELLLAAEYITSAGNEQVVLCERGIRTFETATRNTLDLNAVALLKTLTHLPVIVDPSHGTGVRELIIPMAKAAVACGADGIIVEVHPDPVTALSDSHQQLSAQQFRDLMRQINPFIKAAGRTAA